MFQYKKTLIATLAASAIISNFHLTTFALAQALPEARVLGGLDVAQKYRDGRITFSGWALDSSASGAPVSITIKYGDDIIFKTQTKGGRSDIAKVFSKKNPMNVAFSGKSESSVTCNKQKKLIATGTTASGDSVNFAVKDISGC